MKTRRSPRCCTMPSRIRAAPRRGRNTRPLRRKSRRNCRRLLGHRPHAQAALEAAQARHVAGLADADPSVLLVVSADKLHNARSLLAAYRETGEAIWEQFRGGRQGTLWYYRAAADAIRAAGGTPLSAALERTVADLERAAGSSVKR